MSFNRSFNRLPRFIRVIVVFFVAYITSSFILLWFVQSEYVGFLIIIMFFVSAYFAIKITGRPEPRRRHHQSSGFHVPSKIHIHVHDADKARERYEDSIREGGKRVLGGGMADASRRLSERWGKGK